MGDETRMITNKLEDIIREMAKDVGKIATTQATIQTRQEATFGTVGRIETKVNIINSRVDSLESTRDKAKGMGKTMAVLGGVIGLGIAALKIWL